MLNFNWSVLIIIIMKHLSTFLFILSGCLVFGQKVFGENIATPQPVHQLRIYEIPKENKQVFLYRFRDHALRIMKKYGFTIVSIWESELNEKQNLFTCLSGKMNIQWKWHGKDLWQIKSVRKLKPERQSNRVILLMKLKTEPWNLQIFSRKRSCWNNQNIY